MYTCTQCQQEKPISDFYQQTYARQIRRRSSYCKDCARTAATPAKWINVYGEPE